MQAVQPDLEQDEIANSLILGLSLQLGRAPERILTPTYMRCVMDTEGPALAALMTPPNNLILHSRPGSDPRPAIRLLAADLARLRRTIPGVLAPAEVSLPFAECWKEVTGIPVKAHYLQELMALHEVLAPPPGQGSLRTAVPADLNLVAHWRYAFHREVFGKGSLVHDRRDMAHRIQDGDIFLWEDAGPVSLAIRARPTHSGVSIGSVYTPPDFRRKGYGSACVAELSRLLLGSGWQVLCLFVDLENPVARRIYQNTGYSPVCEFSEYVFGI